MDQRMRSRGVMTPPERPGSPRQRGVMTPSADAPPPAHAPSIRTLLWAVAGAMFAVEAFLSALPAS